MKYLCKLSELENNQSKGFELDDETSVFLVKKSDHVYGYKNYCPHLGVNLEWQPDQFLDSTETLIQCAMHGALFSIESGLCISGPCNGQKLQEIAIHIEEDGIYLDD
ncbi:Rieske (2Fe-2S) protein [Litoribrevibacter euphylliae]|uniref:Rieske (2Fe-2S) protein n=1 Tax=Litoribrevibacter euphylliae TaxID=1834034 RepID=A0ABV7HHF3_9GAMM